MPYVLKLLFAIAMSSDCDSGGTTIKIENARDVNIITNCDS